ncbi:MAG: TRAP transporter small permease [Spirochaetes bacterium]|nr:TRAP transporter small permease [Spirochaetota bacterium]
MKKVLGYIDKNFEEFIGVILLGFVILIIFVGVLMRLILKSGIPLQEELSRMLFVIIIYLGSSFGVRDNDHIRITFVYNKFPAKGRIILRIATDIIWIAYQIMVVILSIDVYIQMAEYPGYTGVMGLPLHGVFAIIPVMFTLVTFRVIQKFFRDFKQKSFEIET